jgi:hypothetical protein
MQKFTIKFKSACKLIGIRLSKSIRVLSARIGSDQWKENSGYGLGLLGQEETPRGSFKMGPLPAELNDYPIFSDRKDGSWGAPPAFK